MFTLIGFILFAVFIIPKPSKIYKNYILRECTCIGIKAVPKGTQGSKIGDEYCVGIPIACKDTKVLKDKKL